MENVEEAVDLLKRASQILNSDQAHTRGSEALSLCEQALEVLGNKGDLLTLTAILVSASTAASYADNPETAVEYGYLALAIVEKDGPSMIAAMVCDVLSRDLRKLGRNAEADSLVRQAHSTLDCLDERFARMKRDLQPAKKWWQFWKDQ